MINKIHERSLRVILNENIISFRHAWTKHRRHKPSTEYSSTGLFKIMNNSAPPIMHDMFTSCVNNFNLRNFQEFATERKKTVKCGLEPASYRCPPTLDTCAKHYKKF